MSYVISSPKGYHQCQARPARHINHATLYDSQEEAEKVALFLGIPEYRVAPISDDCANEIRTQAREDLKRDMFRRQREAANAPA